ncbi:OmpA family protein [uncultured Muriicola sp.]|uniref:OmpA family protein n=1 Tax=uncultured Muriicola sp. TaxID=1583102 RepID=UPI00262CEDDE|nr:OmpA family protein [uncultured Muriicola sp.]
MNIKQFSILFLLLFVSSFSGHAAVLDLSNTEDVTASPKELFKNKAKAHNIITKTVGGYADVYNGYYLITGVFGVSQNANKFARSLKLNAATSGYFKSPENGLHYVYLDHFSAGEDAIASYLDGKYKKKMWILHVENSKKNPSEIIEIVKPNITTSAIQSHSQFVRAAKKFKIATRTVEGMTSIGNGYYAVAGVFGDKNNVSKFVKELRTKGLYALTADNPVSKLTYVYLAHSKDWNGVLKAASSRLSGSYGDKLWIMHIKNETVSTPGTALQPTAVGQFKNSATIPSVKKVFRRNTIKDPPNKLLQKADEYFDKMWYAEAAELYEQFLKNNEDNYTYEVIQKAGDSHYFNTNMERAFYWYDILYNRYKDDISAENIFKYAHSLKGTGKYARAKRLMRLYDRKVKKEGMRYSVDDPRTTPKEKVLDNILSTEQEYTIRNIGTNSEYSDFSPMFYNEDQLVFASAMDSSFFSTRKYKWNNQPYLDLYVAKVNNESQEVKDAIKFSKKINTKYHEASVTFSPDNSTMYFTRNNYGKKLKRDKNGVNNLKIYRSRKVDGAWTEATELPFNSDEFSTGHPALSPDGKQLYFVSDRPGSLGETDIFVVDVYEDGGYSDPRNLGPEINSERKEMFPFISDKKLYFSSNGHIGLGGLDIYEVAFDEENGFQQVKNMGKPVNSKKDDFSYIVNEGTQKGFFASNRRGGKGDDDIYSFSRLLPEELNLNAIAGVVTEQITGEVMPEALVTLLDENNIKLKEVISDKDGSFVFEDLDSNTKYTVKTTKEGYSEVVLNTPTKENELINVEVSLEKLEDLIVLEEGIKKIKLNMIFFNFDKSNIRPDAAAELNKLVAVMQENPSMIIKIESHTDSRGKAIYNKYLSDRRAKSTRAYIISKGIDPKRIESAIGYGEERLLNGCDGSIKCSSDQHQLNRRSEFIIVNM